MIPSAEATLRLTRPLTDRLLDGHPWVYREATRGEAPPGAITTLLDARGNFVARGIADEGPIAMRVFTTRNETLGPSLFRARVEQAFALRQRFITHDTTAWRLLHGEGDRLPGFVCDIYDNVAVLKPDGTGARIWLPVLLEALIPQLTQRNIHTVLLRHPRRNNTDASPKAECIHGTLEAPQREVLEHGMRLPVDLLHGQKTGLFLDQRISRARVRAVANGLDVLNLYGYTGGFSIAAGLGGARKVTTVDVAPAAIELCTDGWQRNGLAPAAHIAEVADVPQYLQRATRAGLRFDLVIADPPSFAPNASSVDSALKSYRALHASSLGRVVPGGLYLAASCSSHITRDAFLQSIMDGARKASRTLQWLDTWGAPHDHPRLPAFPEGDYLKALLFRVE